MEAHPVMGPEVVVGGVHTKLVDDAYTDENGLAFVLTSIGRLGVQTLRRRFVAV
jgi:chromate reductase